MPLQKNQLLTLRIERLSSDGSGVAHSPEGEAVFIPGTAPGDEAQVRIVKDCGRYAFGILDKLLTPSPDRIPVDMIQGGAGTTTNMNANEVIANRALELLGHEKGEYQFCHPNNHVNLSQRSEEHTSELQSH